MSRCLFCYQPLAVREEDFHAFCSKKIFGQPTPPALPYAEADLALLAKEVIQSQIAVTGVQAKLSLHISGNHKEGTKRKFTLVGLWGGYMLKPPTARYPQMPEVEDLTMHLAAIAKRVLEILTKLMKLQVRGVSMSNGFILKKTYIFILKIVN
jgi:serine/threonine-protein kinase HipA